MRSLEHFWDQKFGRNDSENEESTSKGKVRRRDRFFRSKRRLESVQEECASEDTPEPVDVPPFSVDGIPSAAETAQATYIRVLNEDGTSISFGKILSGGDSADASGKVKTIVCFIRHFLCPMCQDYMYSIGRNIDPEVLERAGLRLVIVGNGGWQMIKSYRRIFKLPYAVYTDPTATLYTALGMTLRTLDAGPKILSASSSFSTISISPTSSSSSLPDSTETRPETYVRHKSLLSGVSLVLRNAVKARMPIWRYMGDKALLGGEFVFEKVPGKDISCVWAHRMRYTTAHAEIQSVVGEAQASTVDVGSCSGTECSRSFMTAMSSLSRISSSLDQASLAREMGFVDASSSDLCNTDLSLRDYESLTSRPVSSIYSTIASQTSSTSSWRKPRHKELWLSKEKNRWSKMIGMLDQRLVAASSGDTSSDSSTEGSELDHHLEVEIPAVVDDTRDEEEVFERWFSTAP
ncbi:hypothetical protein F5051DRAFT_320547 [Lentinula edodes]|nr:hypothetical protein F5051DRAFT_320547 [Lentinula edodes]